MATCRRVPRVEQFAVHQVGRRVEGRVELVPVASLGALPRPPVYKVVTRATAERPTTIRARLIR